MTSSDCEENYICLQSTCQLAMCLAKIPPILEGKGQLACMAEDGSLIAMSDYVPVGETCLYIVGNGIVLKGRSTGKLGIKTLSKGLRLKLQNVLIIRALQGE